MKLEPKKLVSRLRPVQISIRARVGNASKNFDLLVEETKKITKDQLREAANRAVDIVKQEPEPYSSDKPYPWVSERQRLFVIINIALGNLIVPRPRTPAYSNSWYVEDYKSGVRIKSTYAAARFMAGTATDPDKQASIHKGRWNPLRVAVEQATAELPKDIKSQVILAARRKGF